MNPIYQLVLYLPNGATDTVRVELPPVAGDEYDYKGVIYIVTKRRFLVNQFGNWVTGASIYLTLPPTITVVTA